MAWRYLSCMTGSGWTLCSPSTFIRYSVKLPPSPQPPMGNYGFSWHKIQIGSNDVGLCESQDFQNL
ncbi:hypothetical protein N7478_008279 [Penicillium angulare]|uniref:uncharacterized protein n=1 Tax=Penicillium angulare TaxID=116970 RepID=UPI002542454D|nr:uncharacterized protein N7478_008279 [Penicillium angulare]KAJ5273154.1 hypothetical protein N7478_008279 [Penicillium angulare]